MSRTRSRTGVATIAVAVAARPGLWVTSIRVLRSFLVSRWWTRAPFVPEIARPYLQFRLETQYGSMQKMTAADSADVVEYLQWVKDWNMKR